MPTAVTSPQASNGLLTGPAPVAAVVAVALTAGALAGGFTDLHVYEHAGRAVLEGRPLTGSDPVTGLPFTYPPFAALLLVPLALLPAGGGRGVVDGRVRRSAGGRRRRSCCREVGRPSPGWLVALLTAGAVALEPVWQNLTFGQVNLLLMLAVLVDVVRPDRRWSGLLLGLAAGVKLTPLVFVVLLVLDRPAVGGGAGRARLRGHGRGGVRRGAGLLDRLLGRPAGRRDPRRATGAGPQPVGVRRPHPVARRRAPDPALARRRRALCRW